MKLSELLSSCTNCNTVKISTIEGIEPPGTYSFNLVPSHYKDVEVNDFTPSNGEIYVTLDM